MLRTGQRRKFVRLAGAGGVPGSFQGINPLLYLPLNDLGNGAVNLVPLVALGSNVATFTRASTDWTKLASGLWAPVAPGIARATYLGRDTAVGAYGGYWSEPAGIQLVTPTAAIRDMTDASWIKVGMTAAKTATGIDGVPNSASTLTATAPGGTILQTLVAAASARDYSVFLRRKTGSGTILIQQGVTTLDVTAQLNSVTYTRVELNASVLNSAFGVQFGSAADAVEADWNQFEALAATQFATSPMATTGAARAADVLTFPFAGNANAATGTAYAELSLISGVGASSMAIGTANGPFGPLRVEVAGTSITVSDGTTAVNKTLLTDMFSGLRKRASSWGGLGQQATGDGVAPSTGAFNGAMPSIAIGIGCSANGLLQMGGTIKGARIFLPQFTSAALQALAL